MILGHMRSTGGRTSLWSVGSPKSPKCLGHMKQRARAVLGVVRVYGPWEVRTKSPMHETHGCAPARKTWGAIGVCGLWEVRTKSPSCDAIVTCVLPVLCVFFRCLAQYSMNSYVYHTDFGRYPFGCSADPCRRCTGFGTTYGQSCRSVWGKYRACNN